MSDQAVKLEVATWKPLKYSGVGDRAGNLQMMGWNTCTLVGMLDWQFACVGRWEGDRRPMSRCGHVLRRCGCKGKRDRQGRVCGDCVRRSAASVGLVLQQENSVIEQAQPGRKIPV